MSDIRYIEGKTSHLPAPAGPGVTYPTWQPAGTVEDEAGIKLADFLAVLRERWRLIAGFGAAAVVLAVLACLLTTPLYSATAVVHVEAQQPQVTTTIAQVDLQSGGLEFMQDQVEILQSRSLAARVIRDLSLDEDPVLLEGVRPSFFQRMQWKLIGYYWTLQKLYAQVTGSDKVRSTVARGTTHSGSNEETSDEVIANVDPGLVSRYLSWLDIKAITNTRMIEVKFTSPSPELSWYVANAHVDGYIRRSLREKFQLTDEARGFLENEIKRVERELTQAEDALNEFRRTHNVVSLDERENAIVERLTDLGRRFTAAQASRITTEAEYRLVKNREFNSLPSVIGSGLVQSLKSEVTRLEIRQSELGEFFLAGNPQVQEVNAQVRQARSRLDREIGRIVSGIESVYLAAKDMEEAIRAEFEQQQSAVLDLKEISGQYIKLDQAVITNRNLYNTLFTRVHETDVVKGAQISNASILDRADLPGGPSHPDVLFTVVFAIVFGLGLGVGMAFIMDHLDSSLKTPEDIRRTLHIPTLGVVPHFAYLPRPTRHTRVPAIEQAQNASTPPARKANVVSLLNGQRVHAEAYRSLRTSLLFCNPANPPRSILVTSSEPGEGKTSTTVNLALSLPQLGSRIICIDADLRNPRCHRLLGIPEAAGLTEVLRGQAKLSDVILEYPLSTGHVRLACDSDGSQLALHVLQSGMPPANPAELLASRRMREVLRELGQLYDTVLIDSPPIFPVTDAAILATVVDGVVLVVRGERTDRQVVREALDRLRFVNATVVGVVLNGVDPAGGYYTQYRHYFAS